MVGNFFQQDFFISKRMIIFTIINFKTNYYGNTERFFKNQ